MKRILTALVLIPVVVWLILKGPEWAFRGVLALIALLCYYEFDAITERAGASRGARSNTEAQAGIASDRTAALIVGMIAGLALLFVPDPGLASVLIALLGMMLALRASNLADAMPRAAVFTLGVIYIFGAWRFARELHSLNPHWLMFALLLSWAGDTAAMYVGKSIGRHKLAPRVSPGKTWEGSIGSVVGGMLAGGVYAHYLIPSASLSIALALAAAGNIAGQLGDLCESALKRGAGVKDSGSSLPGHGGWLDRVDSTLFSVPVVYALLKLL